MDSTDRKSRGQRRAVVALVLVAVSNVWVCGFPPAHAADDPLPRRADKKTGGALPHEQIAGRIVEYGSVVSARGHRVRTVTTRPSNAGRLPVVVFVPWLSCDSVESPRGPTDGWSRMLHTVASSVEAVFVRVDNPGVGDSQGDCSKTTLEDDLAAYRAAIRAALERPDVDASRLTLFGGSLGGAFAPLLAGEFKVHAIAVAGGFSRTWSEHILGHERRRLTLSGATPAAVNTAMRGFVDFYALYLDSRLTPAEVLSRRPDLKPLWYGTPEHQYGRHARYFQEVQAQNEIIFPLVQTIGLKGVVFTDAGNAYGADETISLDNTRFSAGAGLRWLSPVGPLRVELGKPFNTKPHDQKSLLLFSFGGPFQY